LYKALYECPELILISMVLQFLKAIDATINNRLECYERSLSGSVLRTPQRWYRLDVSTCIQYTGDSSRNNRRADQSRYCLRTTGPIVSASSGLGFGIGLCGLGLETQCVIRTWTERNAVDTMGRNGMHIFLVLTADILSTQKPKRYKLRFSARTFAGSQKWC